MFTDIGGKVLKIRVQTVNITAQRYTIWSSIDSHVHQVHEKIECTNSRIHNKCQLEFN